jgi:hypothetical protein
MKITVNSTLLEPHSGARVKDAVLSFYMNSGRRVPKKFPTVEDRFGNRVAPDGELIEGNILFIASGRKKRAPTLKVLAAALIIGLLPVCGSLKHAGTATPPERQAVIFAVNDMH